MDPSVHPSCGMSFVRNCVSIPAVLVACAMGCAGLGGCYDLSTSGPHPEDFASQTGASEPQEQDQTEAKPAKGPTALDRSDTVVAALGTPNAADDAAIPPVQVPPVPAR